MVDQDQAGEDFDDDKLGGEYPPDRPLGVNDEGVTGVEQLGGESFAERDARTRPEVWEEGRSPRRNGSVELVGDQDVGEVDTEGQSVGRAAPEDATDEAGPLADDDEFTGDETQRDVPTERVTPPAEESAVQVDDAAPGATP